MKQRVLGPWCGQFIAVVALRHGDLGQSFVGSYKVFTRAPQGFLDAGSVCDGSCEQPFARAADALAAAEDMAFAVVQGLPPGPARIDNTGHPLHALLYASIARDQLTPFDIGRMLKRARDRNADYGITGMLLLFGQTFMQYIEGPAPQLALVYRVIRKDTLHSGLIELMHTPVPQRTFAGWTMAFDAEDAERWVGNDARPLATMPLDLPDAARVPLALFMQRQG